MLKRSLGLGVAIMIALTATPALAAPAVVWGACPGLPGDVECAKLDVPVDHRNPAAGKLTVDVSRLKATGGKGRELLLLNPGGPGGEGVGLPLAFKDNAIAAKFEVVGFNPRGTGSSLLNCGLPPEPGLPVTRPTEQQIRDYTLDAQRRERACQQAGSAIRPHLSTANTARDMDVIRSALGGKKINYLGFSYGTYLGAVYGSLFPRRMNRSVFDSSMNPEWLYYEQAKQQAVSARQNYRTWSGWAAQHDAHYGFGRTAAEVQASLDALGRALAAKPLVVQGAPYPIDRNALDIVLGSQTPNRKGWADFAVTLKKVREASASGALDLDTAKAIGAMLNDLKLGLELLHSGAFATVTCEAAWSRDTRLYAAEMRRFAAEYPVGRGAHAAAASECAFRSFTPAEPMVPLHRFGYPAGLVVQGDHDPVTGYTGGPVMASRMGYRLVSVVDSGVHGHYGRNDCVTKAIDSYLIDGVLPAKGTTCSGDPRPNP
ncbi:alpha/beta hydrolase [Allokutzneria sp. A3M-2-11 16]|uniref:alpha/beta fold hydrolase n=1 Tax=Allokutzneria sp. A3M-2-11 16 TaxID=2962043 RepID=UPI0020B8F8A3|nr:alpha/beta fold hydrolase [Allokutzneria sp. A3M-2-11 16]MCP3805567.1 alpha/beta hydrolase [Allokutzneria sp. A3M-2-11 16]